jgi:drug/metabolite transporter (DMT)-like permease
MRAAGPIVAGAGLMPAILWAPATVAAATFQVARNALQRGLMPATGPWGATLVRFLFGLPFSLAFAACAFALSPSARLIPSVAFWIAAASGGLAQVLATASLLVAMRRAGFAVGTALQQSSLPLAAVIGLVAFGDRLAPVAWLGVAATTLGFAVLAWPAAASRGAQPVSGAAFGLLSGLCFGFSLNAFRHAVLILDAHHPAVASLATVAVVQAMQAVGLGAWLAARDPGAVSAILRGWRQSLGAGLCGACASAGWFFALALAPAAPVRALGMIEVPVAALAGRRLFQERLDARRLVGGAAVVAGVVLTILA